MVAIWPHGSPSQTPQSPPATPPMQHPHLFQASQLHNGNYANPGNNGGFFHQRGAGTYGQQRTPMMGHLTATSPPQQFRPLHSRIMDEIVYTSDSVLPDAIAARIYRLFGSNLRWEPRHLEKLAVRYTNVVIDLGKSGHLGPRGISSVEDIFYVIGNEGTKKYLALAVMSPSPLRILLKGDAVEADGDPLTDEDASVSIRGAFREVALREWNRLDGEARWQERRS